MRGACVVLIGGYHAIGEASGEREVDVYRQGQLWTLLTSGLEVYESDTSQAVTA